LNPKHGRSQTELIWMSQKNIKKHDEGRFSKPGALQL